ncbi:Zinc finger C2HC domain-containing protein 1C, partial [Podochytrium sp. JEL0797]
MSTTKRHLTDIPTVTPSTPAFQPPTTLKRVPILLSRRNSVAAAAEELSLAKLGIQSEIHPAARGGCGGGGGVAKPRVSGGPVVASHRSQSQQQQQQGYTDYSSPSGNHDPQSGSIASHNSGGPQKRESLDSAASSIHRPASYKSNNTRFAEEQEEYREANRKNNGVVAGYPSYEVESQPAPAQPEEYPEGAGGAEGEDRVACHNCNRKFAQDRLERHVNACSKMKQRKVFDTTKARVKGTELEQYAMKAKMSESAAKKQ